LEFNISFFTLINFNATTADFCQSENSMIFDRTAKLPKYNALAHGQIVGTSSVVHFTFFSSSSSSFVPSKFSYSSSSSSFVPPKFSYSSSSSSFVPAKFFPRLRLRLSSDEDETRTISSLVSKRVFSLKFSKYPKKIKKCSKYPKKIQKFFKNIKLAFE
jgi:hypothetical protein